MSTTLEASSSVDAVPPSAAMVASNAKPRRRWPFALLVLVMVVVGGGLWFVPGLVGQVAMQDNELVFRVSRRSFPVIEEAKGELKAAKTLEIKSKVEGRSTIKWVIEEGTNVEEGELLVSLSSDQIDDRIRRSEADLASAVASLEAAEKDLEILIDENASEIRKADLKLELAQIELQKYNKGDAINNEEDALAEIERARSMVDRSQLDYNAAVKLEKEKFITRSELLQDEFDLAEAKRSLAKAERNLETLRKYSHPMEIKKFTSDVDEAEKELERVRKSALAKEAQKKADVEAKRANLLNVQSELSKFREQKQFAEIRAPAPGIVVYHTGHRWNRQTIDVGAEVYEGQTLVKLPDPSVMVVSVRIHEAKTHKIKLDQQVRVEVEGIPGEIFTGKISKIAPLADSRNSWLNPDLKEYETEITLNEAKKELKPGATARAEIFIAEMEDVIAVPVQAVFSEAGQQFVFVQNGRSIDPKPVDVGLSSTEYVEITEGLTDSESIMLAVSPQDRLKITDIVAAQEDDAEANVRQVNMKSKPRGKRPPRGGGPPQRAGRS